MSIIEFTTNEEVKKISEDRQYIEIIGYVDEVIPVDRVGYYNHKLMKFVINNVTGKRIPCLVWGKYITTTAKDVEKNKIIRLNGLKAKRRRKENLHIGNTSIELTIGARSTLKILGNYPPTENGVNNATGQGTDSPQSASSQDIEDTTDDSEIGPEENKPTMYKKGTRLFDEYLSAFFMSCNRADARFGTFWIVILKKSSRGNRDMIIGGRNVDRGPHVDDIFLMWWRTADPKVDFTSVEVYTNNTPCATCARKLRIWLKENENVDLTIYFAFIYTWPGNDVPVSEYVGRLQELRNLPNRIVRMKKIDKHVIKNLAEYLGIQFKGYPWYDYYFLENQIITD